MVQVYLWRPRRTLFSELSQVTFGHISIDVAGTYISFWPSKGKLGKSGKENPGIVNADFPDYSVTSYSVDTSDERMNGQADCLITIDGMYERAMTHDWEVVKKSSIRYSIPISTCASIANVLLKAGFVNSRVGRATRPDHRHIQLNRYVTESQSPISKSIMSPIPVNSFLFAMLIKNLTEQRNETEEQVSKRWNKLFHEDLWTRLGLPRAVNTTYPTANAVFLD